MSFSSTPKAAFLYFSQQFSNWGGEFLSKSLGAILNSRTDKIYHKRRVGGGGVGSWGDWGPQFQTFALAILIDIHSTKLHGVPAKYLGYPTKYLST